jgi:hypothetical protein
MEGLGTGAYRIDWFGQIYRGTASGVAVVLSRWCVDPDTGEVGPDSSARTSVVIPVAFLRMFRIGDIWEHGRFTGRSDVRARETFGLTIGPDSVKVKPAGAPLDGDPRWPVFPLPFAEFDGHREHTQAFCASIGLSDNATLVIPCMELVRFYFGASGSFLKRLFSGAFALDNLCTGVRFNLATGAANIDLANDLPGAAAATVARIALDGQARSAAAWVVNSSVAASASGKRYYPKTTFPFLGETELTVLGRWLDTSGHRVFLAEQVICCTHPFPFASLYYTTSRSPLSPTRALRSTDLETPPEQSTANGPEADLRLDEGTVSGQLQPVGVAVDGEADDPFPDLRSKKIRRVKSEERRHGGCRTREELPTIGVGDDSACSDMRAAEVTESSDLLSFDEASVEEAPSEAIEAFSNAVQLYARVGGHYNLKCPPEANGNDKRQGEFVHGSTLCSIPDSKLADVWCSTVEIGETYPIRTLALVRGDVTREYGDHLTLVQLSESDDHSDEIAAHVLAFAHGTLSQTARDRILFTKHTQLLGDQMSLLRGLSVAANLAHQRRYRENVQNGTWIPRDLDAATISMD